MYMSVDDITKKINYDYNYQNNINNANLTMRSSSNNSMGILQSGR